MIRASLCRRSGRAADAWGGGSAASTGGGGGSSSIRDDGEGGGEAVAAGAPGRAGDLEAAAADRSISAEFAGARAGREAARSEVEVGAPRGPRGHAPGRRERAAWRAGGFVRCSGYVSRA